MANDEILTGSKWSPAGPGRMKVLPLGSWHFCQPLPAARAVLPPTGTRHICLLSANPGESMKEAFRTSALATACHISKELKPLQNTPNPPNEQFYWPLVLMLPKTWSVHPCHWSTYCYPTKQKPHLPRSAQEMQIIFCYTIYPFLTTIFKLF